MKLKRLFFVLMIILTAAAFAEPAEDTLQFFQSNDSIIVVANRYKTSIKNLAYNYQVISKEQIQSLSTHSALEVVDLQFPSAYIMEKKVMGYGLGTAGSGQVYLRGQGGHPNTGVLVLLNGHPDFMGIFGHPLPDVYGIDDIEQVEILPGAASTVFGSQAMGGVINLVTQPTYENTAKISLEGGSFSTYKLGLSLAEQFGAHGFFFSARQKKSDGHVEQTDFESLHFQGGWNYQINPQWSLSTHARYVPYSFDDPYRGDADTASLGAFGKIKRGTGEIILRNSMENLSGSTQAYGNFGEHRFYNGFESNDFTIGLSSYQNWRLNEQLNFAAGFDVMHYGGKAKNDFAFLPNGKPFVNPEQREVNTGGIYVMGFYQPFSFLHFKAGGRYQYYDLPLSNFSPMAGITIHVLKGLKWYANYQTGFRSPTLQEMYLFPFANENLDEEEIYTYESGLAYRISNQLTVQLAAYKNDIKNKIQLMANPTPPPFSRFQNSGEGEQWGLESQIKYRILSNLGLMLAYSYLEPDFLTAFNPKHQIKYMINGQWQNYHVSLYGKYVEDIYSENKTATNIKPNALPDYHVLNLSLTAKYSHIDLSVRLKNLLDRSYLMTVINSEFIGVYPLEAPGFHFLVGLDVKL